MTPGFQLRIPRWYVPVVIVALFLGANALVVKMAPTNTLTGGQNRRLSFQASGEVGYLVPLAGVQGPSGAALAGILRDLPPNRHGTLSVLYIGNSQTMAIMDMEPGDRIVVAWFASLLNHGDDGPFAVRLASEANLTMSELLLKTVVAALDPSRRPDVEVVGIVLDGLRWVEARGELVKFAESLGFREQVRRLLENGPPLPAAARAVEGLLQHVGAGSELGGGATGEPGSRDARSIARVERQLQDRTEKLVPLFRARRHLLGTFKLKYTALRNWVVGFTTTTKRPIAPALYATNLEFIELTLRFLRRQGIKGVFYLAPIRPVEPNPYVPEDIDRFRKELASLCERYGAVYMDYSRLIPEALWTNYPESDRSGIGGQPDFAHFTGRAHQVLAERLVADLRPMFHSWLTDKR